MVLKSEAMTIYEAVFTPLSSEGYRQRGERYIDRFVDPDWDITRIRPPKKFESGSDLINAFLFISLSMFNQNCQKKVNGFWIRMFRLNPDKNPTLLKTGSEKLEPCRNRDPDWSQTPGSSLLERDEWSKKWGAVRIYHYPNVKCLSTHEQYFSAQLSFREKSTKFWLKNPQNWVLKIAGILKFCIFSWFTPVMFCGVRPTKARAFSGLTVYLII